MGRQASLVALVAAIGGVALAALWVRSATAQRLGDADGIEPARMPGSAGDIHVAGAVEHGSNGGLPRPAAG